MLAETELGKDFGLPNLIIPSTNPTDMLFGLVTPSHVMLFRVKLEDIRENTNGMLGVKGCVLKEEWSKALDDAWLVVGGAISRHSQRFRLSLLRKDNKLASFGRDGTFESTIDLGENVVHSIYPTNNNLIMRH